MVLSDEILILIVCFFFDLDGGFSNVFRYKKSIYFTLKKQPKTLLLPHLTCPTAPVLLVPFFHQVHYRP